MKSIRSHRIILIISILIVLPISAGCWGTSATFHYDRDTVWKVAVGQSIIWRPNVIDDKNYEISTTKQNPAGNEIKYQVKVRRDPNIFATKPSTKVYVYIRQTKPHYIRLRQFERDFLARLAEELHFMKLNPLQQK